MDHQRRLLRLLRHRRGDQTRTQAGAQLDAHRTGRRRGHEADQDFVFSCSGDGVRDVRERPGSDGQRAGKDRRGVQADHAQL